MQATPRLAVTFTFIAFGVIVGSQIGAFPVLKEQSGLDRWMFGVLSGLTAVMNVAGLGFGGLVNRKFDHRSVILFILPVMTVLLGANLLSRSALGFGTSAMCFALSFGTLDLFMNAEGSVVERDAAKPVFASFHAAALYAIGLFGLVAGYIAVTFGAAWAVVPAVPAAAAAMWAVNRAIPHHPRESAETAAKGVIPRYLLTLIGMILGLDVACELGSITWAGQLLAEKQPALAAYSGLGVAFYGICNGTVRLFGDRLRARYSDTSLTAASFGVALCGFTLLALNPGFLASVAAFALVGGGLGLIFPCMFAVAAKLAPQARAAALSHASAVSGPPRVIFPFVFGWIAQNYGLNAIYWLDAAASVAAVGVTLWTARAIARSKT